MYVTSCCIRMAIVCLTVCCLNPPLGRAEDETKESTEVRTAIERSLKLLERTSATTAEERKCFTCHGQALPVFTFVEASSRGYPLDPANVKRQADHTYAHLRRGRKQYLEGKGQGGQVDMAGYALWTLHDDGRQGDQVTDAVIDYLLKKQSPDGKWPRASNRPPSEGSTFTSTYLALRSLEDFGNDQNEDRIESATARAAEWLKTAEPVSTEDHVFYVLALRYANVDPQILDGVVDELKKGQRKDGGWSQLESMESDAYATATVMYALNQSGVGVTDSVWLRGQEFLLNSQLEDGSWHVVSRSKPFQKYFESAFPHGKDQFISTTATAWATIALLHSLPKKELTNFN